MALTQIQNAMTQLLGNSSGALSIDSSGNVGIGTSSPSQKLEVAGNIKSSGYIWGTTNVYSGDGSVSDTAFGRSAGTGTGMYFPAAETIGFCTVGTERVRIDSSGNLGLGVTPSAWGPNFRAIQLGTGANESGIAGQINANYLSIVSNGYNNGTNWIYKNTAPSGLYQILQNAHYWQTAPSGTAGNAISFTQAMTLDAYGRLLVGFTGGGLLGRINSYASDGGYGFVAQSGTYGLRTFSDTSNGGYSIQSVDGTAMVSYQPLLLGGGGIKFFTGTVGGGVQTEAMRLNSSGNLGIGTASPTTKLHISQGQFEFIYSYLISDYRGVCDGTTGGYLLIIPAYPGSGIVSGKKFYGTIIADRGGLGSGNSTNIAYIHASTAYNSGTFNVQVSVSNQYFASVHLVTYSGTQYYALRFTSTGGGPDGGIYISGAHRGLDANCLTMKLDSEVSNVSAFGNRTVLFP